mmetsp:Transcript_10884/g.21739  ORF Transcript_10884/g.21739 Transcript_10884/m.21739 type:complete len:484 (+) Transcript_10884:310-1761(+)
MALFEMCWRMASALHRHLKEFGGRLADAVNLKADRLQLFVVYEVAPIEQKRGLRHRIEDLLVVVRLELVPLGEDGDGVGAGGGFVRVGARDEHFVKPRVGILGHVQGVVHFRQHLLSGHFGVVDVHDGGLFEQVPAHKRGRGFAGVARVLLEREPEHADLLGRDGVEHATHHDLGEAPLLVLVHQNHLMPVVRALFQPEGLANVHEVEDVFLEARAPEPHRRVEELGADAVVKGQSALHLVHVRVRGLAQGRDGVDAGHALGEKCVGHELRHFGRPQVGGQNALPRHPVLVHRHQGLNRGEPFRVLHAPNEHAPGGLQVFDGRALGEELGVREHLELESFFVVGKHRGHGLSGADGDGGLLHDDLALGGHLGDVAGRELAVFDVGRPPGPDAVELGGGVDGDEDHVRVLHHLVHVGGEKKVLVARLLHHRVEARLVDREVIAIPSVNLLLGEVQHRHLDVGTVVCDDRHRRSSDIACTKAAYL